MLAMTSSDRLKSIEQQQKLENNDTAGLATIAKGPDWSSFFPRVCDAAKVHPGIHTVPSCRRRLNPGNAEERPGGGRATTPTLQCSDIAIVLVSAERKGIEYGLQHVIVAAASLPP
jgi:hypothetical protein